MPEDRPDPTWSAIGSFLGSGLEGGISGYKSKKSSNEMKVIMDDPKLGPFEKMNKLTASKDILAADRQEAMKGLQWEAKFGEDKRKLDTAERNIDFKNQMAIEKSNREEQALALKGKEFELKQNKPLNLPEDKKILLKGMAEDAMASEKSLPLINEALGLLNKRGAGRFWTPITGPKTNALLGWAPLSDDQRRLEAITWEVMTQGGFTLPRIKTEFEKLMTRFPSLSWPIETNIWFYEQAQKKADLSIRKYEEFEKLRESGKSDKDAMSIVNKNFSNLENKLDNKVLKKIGDLEKKSVKQEESMSELDKMMRGE